MSSAQISVQKPVTGLLVALALIATFALSAQASDQSDFKAKFKQGCADSHGTWIENSDDSYQCTARSGEVNKCYPNTPPTPCTHSNF